MRGYARSLISELVDSFENDKKYSLNLKEYQPNPAKFIVSINRYLFNNDSTQFKILISNYFTTLEEFHLLEAVIDKASKNNKIFFLKYLKNEQKKEGTNILSDAEIVVPNLDKKENK